MVSSSLYFWLLFAISASRRNEAGAFTCSSHSSGRKLSSVHASTMNDSPNMETAWRHIKKPLISIGSKGITGTHGNSLRELLNAHTAVKVKIRSIPLEVGFQQLVDAAVSAGAPDSLELLQSRSSDAVIMIGLPGTRQRIEDGTFPPPPPPPKVRDFSNQDEEPSG